MAHPQKHPQGGTALRFQTLAELLEDQTPAPEVILQPWLKQGDSAMIYAAPASGKSMFVLGLALTIAGGGKFLGWEADRPRKVLFVDGEMPKADIIERARLLLPAAEGIDAAAAGRNLEVLARQAQDLKAKFPDLGKEQDQEQVIQMARAHGAELVILDNFSTLVEVEDENSAAAMNPIVRFLMRMKQAKLACILIHHSGKNKTDYRGSSKLATTFEVIMQLQKPEGPQTPHRLEFDLDWNKHRRQQDETTRARRVWLDIPRGGTGKGAWGYEVARKEYLSEIVARARSHEYPTQKALAAALGISTGELSKRKGEAILNYKMITAEEWRAHFAEAQRLASGEEEEEEDFEF